MTVEQLKERAESCITHQGPEGSFSILVPGAYPDSGRKRLAGRSGPWGECVAEFESDVLVAFKGKDMLRWLKKEGLI